MAGRTAAVPTEVVELVADVRMSCGDVLVQLDRLAGKQGAMALAAVGLTTKVIGAHAVGGVAMGTHNVQGFAGHAASLVSR